MSAHPRNWTADEDDLMRRQSQGQFSMFKLERALLSNRESIINRMKELGYTPIIQKRKGMRACVQVFGDFIPNPEPEIPSDIINFAPHVGNDKLLLRLHQYHEDRRYEELDLPMKRRAQ